MVNQPSVVILGAGVCGLYAGYVLASHGLNVTVIEREAFAGGLCAGFERNGNFYELGVHHLHGFDREILEDIQSIMGDRLIPTPLRALIRFGNSFRRYPLEFMDLLTGIPPWKLLNALSGLITQQLSNRLSSHARNPMNAEEALIQLYGRPLYRYFFRDFTREYWGIPAEKLSATFVRTRMPRLSAVDAARKLLGKFGLKVPAQAVASALRDETLWYAPTGIQELSLAFADSIIRNGGSVMLSCPVTSVEVINKNHIHVHCRSREKSLMIPASSCISTLPITDLIRNMTPQAPADVLSACDFLRYKPIAVYAFLIRKKKISDASYMHFRSQPFHRIAEPKNSGLLVTPPEYTILLTELTCEEGDDRWYGTEKIRDQIVCSLHGEGLVAPEEIVESHHFRALHGYPVFRLGFEPHLERIKHFICRFQNLRSVGRQGGYAYFNMHSAMRAGAEAGREMFMIKDKV